MKQVGLFQAKTRLSELCDRVARDREAIVITRRGRPLVRLEPLTEPPEGSSIWEARERFTAREGTIEDDLELPERPLEPDRSILE